MSSALTVKQNGDSLLLLITLHLITKAEDIN